MKRQIVKRYKSILSIGLLMILLTGAFDVTGFSAKAEEYAYTKDTVLAEHDYTGAIRSPESRSADFWQYSGDFSPAADPKDTDNTVMRYKSQYYGLGLTLLGHDYKASKVNNRITLKAGVTYKVEFKLYTKGTAESNMEIGLAVGADNFKAEFSAYPGADWKTGLGETTYEKYLEPRAIIVAYDKGTAGTEKWESCSTTITVPADADVTTKNALYLYCQAGDSVYAYIDDVKVTALAGVAVDYVVGDKTVSVYYADGKIPAELPKGIETKDAKGNELVLYTDTSHTTVFSAEKYERIGRYTKVTLYGEYQEPEKTDTVIAENNYDGALRQEESRSDIFYKYSGDLSPAAAPDDANNTVLRYKQSYHGLGLALLGHDYKAGTVSNRVKVEAGMAYKVDFALYTKGITESPMEIGLAVGADNYEEGFRQNASDWQTGLGEISYKAYLGTMTTITTIPKGKTLIEGWENYTAYITIPKDTDVLAKNALYIYLQSGGDKAQVYIDNVKVTALAGVTVNYVIGNKTVSVYYADGRIPAKIPEGVAAKDAEGKELVLYTDAAYTTVFSAEKYERTGKSAKVTLYGRYQEREKVDVVVAENDYEGATKPKDSWEGGFFNYSGDLYPATAPDNANNTALWYHPLRVGIGLALLGHDYVNAKVENRVKVEAGVTYKVEFSLYTKGTTGTSMELGLAVGADDFGGKIDETNYTDYLSTRMKIETFPSQTALKEGWKTYVSYITVPKDADVTEKNALYIYLKGGDNTANAYIDNVKVTALAKAPQTGDLSLSCNMLIFIMIVAVFVAAVAANRLTVEKTKKEENKLIVK